MGVLRSLIIGKSTVFQQLVQIDIKGNNKFHNTGICTHEEPVHRGLSHNTSYNV